VLRSPTSRVAETCNIYSTQRIADFAKWISTAPAPVNQQLDAALRGLKQALRTQLERLINI
jgi:hypothetical protein